MTRIKKVTIAWADAEWEYELELTGCEAEYFDEDYAEQYAREEAAKMGTTFEELVGIECETKEPDEEECWYAWQEFMWECETGR